VGIFVDTSFFLGLVHPKDKNHQRIVDLLKKVSLGGFGLIYSSPLVISETATIILVRTKNNLDLLNDFYDLIYGEEQFIRIIPWTSILEQQSWRIFLNHNRNAKSKKEYLSFVDASNIGLCRNFKIDRIVAYDGDFDPYLIRIC